MFRGVMFLGNLKDNFWFIEFFFLKKKIYIVFFVIYIKSVKCKMNIFFIFKNVLLWLFCRNVDNVFGYGI